MRRPAEDRVEKLLARIHFACRARHVADPETGQVLSSHQASILEHLDVQRPLTLSELASHMRVTVSTMSLAMRRLVAEGYVDRDRDPDDGRRVCLRLTPAGARMKQAKSVLDPGRVAAMLGALSTEERKAALDGLALLARAAVGMAEERPPDSRTEPAEEAGPAQLEDGR
jgi:DNA-binding MarR family transcriptional regulator